MKFAVLLILQTLLSNSVISQTNEKFDVHYVSKQNATFEKEIKNKTVDITYKDSNNVERRIKTPVTFTTSDFQMEAFFGIIADRNGSKMYFGKIGNETHGGNITLTMNTPDTIFYTNGQWTRLIDGSIETIEEQSFDVKETSETKIILGYLCNKFLNNEGNMVFWASKELPKTLLPYTGLKEFKYGILEIQNEKDKISIVATKIIKH